jgi:hypothetical protein
LGLYGSPNRFCYLQWDWGTIYETTLMDKSKENKFEPDQEYYNEYDHLRPFDELIKQVIRPSRSHSN